VRGRRCRYLPRCTCQQLALHCGHARQEQGTRLHAYHANKRSWQSSSEAQAEGWPPASTLDVGFCSGTLRSLTFSLQADLILSTGNLSTRPSRSARGCAHANAGSRAISGGDQECGPGHAGRREYPPRPAVGQLPGRHQALCAGAGPAPCIPVPQSGHERVRPRSAGR